MRTRAGNVIEIIRTTREYGKAGIGRRLIFDDYKDTAHGRRARTG